MKEPGEAPQSVWAWGIEYARAGQRQRCVIVNDGERDRAYAEQRAMDLGGGFIVELVPRSEHPEDSGQPF